MEILKFKQKDLGSTAKLVSGCEMFAGFIKTGRKLSMNF
jgi:hypothetical protein